MGFLDKLFGPKIDFKALLAEGAVIIDVRSPGEFKSGHIPGSINIPLQDIQRASSKLSKDKPIITCCASGIRSASAKSMLKASGFKEVHNGGGYISLHNKL